MAWIETIGYDAAKGKLKRLYERIKGPDGKIDNILAAHSLRPHSLDGHMRLYKNVLHHSDNTLPKAYLETIGVFVSILNGCHYCVAHHFAGLQRLLNDDARAAEIRTALDNDTLAGTFEKKELAGLRYARRLTISPKSVSVDDINILSEAGFSDGEILEMNQVTAYFSYANRTVLGLGVTTDGDTLGLSPNNSDDPENWNHS